MQPIYVDQWGKHGHLHGCRAISCRVLIGQDPVKIEACLSTMDQVIYGNSSIKSAFDIALYDLASQNAEVPLYAYLGGRKNKVLVTDYTVSLGDKQKMVRDALRIKANGFQVIKVKLGDTGENDIERIRLIREAVGSDIPLRIDANQGWDVSTAISTLKALQSFEIQHCEEPIPDGILWNLQTSENRVRFPLWPMSPVVTITMPKD